MINASNIQLFLFLLNTVGGLVMFVFTKMFVDRIDKLQASFDKMAEKLENYVKIQDHKEDLSEVKRRIDKLEDIFQDLTVKINAPRK